MEVDFAGLRLQACVAWQEEPASPVQYELVDDAHDGELGEDDAVPLWDERCACDAADDVPDKQMEVECELRYEHAPEGHGGGDCVATKMEDSGAVVGLALEDGVDQADMRGQRTTGDPSH